jgi:hypothetical protein
MTGYCVNLGLSYRRRYTFPLSCPHRFVCYASFSPSAASYRISGQTVDVALSFPVTKDARRDKALWKGGALEALVERQKTGEQR